MRGADGIERFPDGSPKPYLSPERYDGLRNDDRFLYNRGPNPMDTVDSTSDDRTTNNVVRHEYRVLTDHEKIAMQRIKDGGEELIRRINKTRNEIDRNHREFALGVTNAEQAVMWAIKGLTA